MMLQQTHGAEIERIVARYAQKRSAVLPVLFLAQDTYGHLTDAAVREVAQTLGLPETEVFEVVGFYSLFYSRPVGQWVLQVCDDVPCCFTGAEELISALKGALGLEEGQTTADGSFLLQRVKCLAACNKAPVVQANLDYYYRVDAERADALLSSLRERAAGGALSVSGRFAEDYEPQNGGFARIERPRQEVPQAEAVLVESEAAKAAEGEAESMPEQAAQGAAEERIAAESPVAPSLDQSPAGEHPASPNEEAAVPARPTQQQPVVEKPSDS